MNSLPEARWITLRVMMWLLLAVGLISIQYAPSVIHQGRDSGIFAYTGKVILDGKLPYADAWDNKLPGVFYIDAAAFWVFGANNWALWITEMMFIALTALLMFWLLERLCEPYTRPPARALPWAGALLLVVLVRHPALLSGINFTEPYALLFQMVVWAAGYKFLRQPSTRAGFVIGFASGVALLVKQTTVGAAFALIPAIWISRHPVWRDPRRWRYLASMIAGGLFCLGLMALFLAAQGILDDALKASFLEAGSFHKWVGRGTPWIGMTIWHSLSAMEFLAAFGPLFPLWLMGAWRIMRGMAAVRSNDQPGTVLAAVGFWALGAFAINLALANVTDRAYAHYYVPLIPSVVIIIVLGLIPSHKTVPSVWRRRAWRYLVALLLWLPIGMTLGRFWFANWDIFDLTPTDEIAAYVIDHTEPGDYVWVWGANTRVNFQSGRDSPTQYTYAYPLIVPGELSEKRIAEVIDDLTAHPPVMIVDSTLVDGNRVPPLDAERRALWWTIGGRRDVANLEPIYHYVAEHCAMVDEINHVAMYRCQQ